MVIVNTVEHVTSNLSVDLAQAHGQFTNSLESLLPTKTYLDKLSSTYDFDLFILNIDSNLNPDCNFAVQQTCCHYYSPYSFSLFKNILKVYKNACFSLLHNNVRSLKRNLENLQAHSLDELDHNFSIIGVSETKITRRNSLEFNQDLPNIWVEVHLKYVWNVYCVVTDHMRDLHTTATTGNEPFPIGHGTNYFHFVLIFSLFTSKQLLFLPICQSFHE